MEVNDLRKNILDSYLGATNNNEKKNIKNDIYTLDEIIMKYFGQAWDDEKQMYE